jgi:hypothetical protein
MIYREGEDGQVISKERLEKLEAEIRAETNSFVRGAGWYLYWTLHQKVYVQAWAKYQHKGDS